MRCNVSPCDVKYLCAQLFGDGGNNIGDGMVDAIVIPNTVYLILVNILLQSNWHNLSSYKNYVNKFLTFD